MSCFAESALVGWQGCCHPGAGMGGAGGRHRSFQREGRQGGLAQRKSRHVSLNLQNGQGRYSLAWARGKLPFPFAPETDTQGLVERVHGWKGLSSYVTHQMGTAMGEPCWCVHWALGSWSREPGRGSVVHIPEPVTLSSTAYLSKLLILFQCQSFDIKDGELKYK